MEFEPKVFGIGLPWTGQAALYEALKTLKYRVVHDPEDTQMWCAAQQSRTDFILLQKYDGIVGLPASLVESLDVTWPGSKFILTVRDRKFWLPQAKKAYAKLPPPLHHALPAPLGLDRFRRHVQPSAVEDTLLDYYKATYIRTIQYFYGVARPNALLMLNVCRSDGWKSLCEFLDRPVPRKAFPQGSCEIEGCCRSCKG
jgi:hypothetical protein